MGVQTQATALSTLPSPQRTLQKQSVVYGGKSTIRDRSSGTASSVAFTPLQVPALWGQQARRRPCSPVLGCCFLSRALLRGCHGFGRGAPKKPPRLHLDS